MRGTRTLVAMAVGAAALAGCATPARVSPVEVTRFTGSTPAELGQGTIHVEPATGYDADSIEFSAYAAELESRLAALGYTVVSGESRQVAVLDIERMVTAEPRRSPVTVGGNAGVGSYGSGVGLGVGIDLSGPPPETIDTSVAVYIRPTAGGPNLWEGRARFSATANSDYADAAPAAARAIAALFTDFPGRSGETIEID